MIQRPKYEKQLQTLEERDALILERLEERLAAIQGPAEGYHIWDEEPAITDDLSEPVMVDGVFVSTPHPSADNPWFFDAFCGGDGDRQPEGTVCVSRRVADAIWPSGQSRMEEKEQARQEDEQALRDGTVTPEGLAARNNIFHGMSSRLVIDPDHPLF